MRTFCAQTRLSPLLIGAAALLLSAFPVRAEISASYLFKLSDFSGTVPYSIPRITVDDSRHEVYVAAGETVGIFNDQGMEVFRFGGGDVTTRSIYDVALDREGVMYVLTYAFTENRGLTYRIERRTFRGETDAVVNLKGLPAEAANFRPMRMALLGDHFYLADLNAMRIVIMNASGEVQEVLDLAGLIGLGEDSEDIGIMDVNIGRDGSILFTSPVLARAYRVTPERNVDAFGKRGSTQGRFGIPTSMISDDAGNYYVADALRSVIMVFNERFEFQKEFGGRGHRPENIVGPRSLALDARGRLYVSQVGSRGVSVFQISRN